MRHLLTFFALIFSLNAFCAEEDAYRFLKQKSLEGRRQVRFNEYEDIISGSVAFLIGNVGYFSTKSSTLKLAYSGVQTIGIIAVGHGIHDYYYPHFETRLLEILSQENLTKGQLADNYVNLLGEMERAKRLSLLWSSSLLAMQYTLNSVVSSDVGSDLKDVYIFLGGVNVIVALYSYFNVSDYEKFYKEYKLKPAYSIILEPGTEDSRIGIGVTKAF